MRVWQLLSSRAASLGLKSPFEYPAVLFSSGLSRQVLNLGYSSSSPSPSSTHGGAKPPCEADSSMLLVLELVHRAGRLPAEKMGWRPYGDARAQRGGARTATSNLCARVARPGAAQCLIGAEMVLAGEG